MLLYWVLGNFFIKVLVILFMVIIFVVLLFIFFKNVREWGWVIMLSLFLNINWELVLFIIGCWFNFYLLDIMLLNFKNCLLIRVGFNFLIVMLMEIFRILLGRVIGFWEVGIIVDINFV